MHAGTGPPAARLRVAGSVTTVYRAAWLLAVHGQIDAQLAPPRSDDSVRPYYSYYHPPGPRYGAGSLTHRYDLAALTSSHNVNSTLTTCSRCMVRSMRSLHHLDLTTRFVHTTHIITLQALNTALARSHIDMTSLLSPRLTTSTPLSQHARGAWSDRCTACTTSLFEII